MKKKDIALLIGFFVLIAHTMVIANDVNVVLNDPNKNNKPGEILKLAFDVSRYLR